LGYGPMTISSGSDSGGHALENAPRFGTSFGLVGGARYKPCLKFRLILPNNIRQTRERPKLESLTKGLG
jgi:hypothetical protein